MSPPPLPETTHMCAHLLEAEARAAVEAENWVRVEQITQEGLRLMRPYERSLCLDMIPLLYACAVAHNVGRADPDAPNPAAIAAGLAKLQDALLELEGWDEAQTELRVLCDVLRLFDAILTGAAAHYSAPPRYDA